MMRTVFVYAIGIMLSASNWAYCDGNKELRGALLNGKTVQLDTSFPYYKNRSDESIASEVELNGYNGVHIIVCGEKDVSKSLIKSFHEIGMPAGAQFFASSVYTPNDVLPRGWQKWKMEFTSDEMNKHVKFLSYVYEDYREWMKKRVVKVIGDYGFDGVTFPEPMYPVFDGLSHKPVLYADVSKGFQEHFKKATGNSEFPEFVNAESPNYYLTNTKLYNDLVKYRIKTISDFYGELVNGKGGIREKHPSVVVGNWTLAVSSCGPDKIAEWEGDDIVSMIQAVKPDIHWLQTHYPDWINPATKGDYVKSYRPYMDRIRTADKNLKIGVEGDLGSFATMRRDPNWTNTYYKTCAEENVDGTMFYEFSIRWQVYECAPVLKKAVKNKGRAIKLYFDKRIADDNGKWLKGRIVTGHDGSKYTVKRAKVDGNILKLELDKAPKAGSELNIPVGGICDDPSIRYVTGDLPKGKMNKIPEGTSENVKPL